MPLKTQDYIHSKLDATLSLEYFDFSFDEHNKSVLTEWTEWRYILGEHLRDPLIIRRKLCSFLRRSYLKFQKIINIKQHYDVELAKASNWFSITEACCDYILSKSSWLKDNFKYTHVSDEIAIPTLIINSPFRENISRESIRKIYWNRGATYTWNKDDLDELLTSSSLFARKFTSKDMNFIYKLSNIIKYPLM